MVHSLFRKKKKPRLKENTVETAFVLITELTYRRVVYLFWGVGGGRGQFGISVSVCDLNSLQVGKSGVITSWQTSPVIPVMSGNPKHEHAPRQNGHTVMCQLCQSRRII